MVRRLMLGLAALATLAGATAQACSLCPMLGSRSTFREDHVTARMVIYGTLTNSRVGADGLGSTDLAIESIIKSDPVLADRKVLELPRYVPVDPKSPPKFLVFCDIINGKIDPYRGTPVKTPAVVDYLKRAMALPDDPAKRLQFYFDYLDSADNEVAVDAFHEFAKASDADVARTARQLDPSRLRKLLIDTTTPPERLSLFAYLLGASGGPSDFQFLTELSNDSSERLRPAFGGIIAGLIQLDPKKGWSRAQAILGDANRPFAERHATLCALRFFHGANPESSRPEILQAFKGTLAQGDLADLAIEELRRWKWWDLTAEILACYDKPTHAAPIMKRTILRYALSCPLPEAKPFVERIRAANPELVQDIEESLRFESPVKAK